MLQNPFLYKNINRTKMPKNHRIKNPYFEWKRMILNPFSVEALTSPLNVYAINKPYIFHVHIYVCKVRWTVFPCAIYAIECNSVFTVMICTNLWRKSVSSEMCVCVRWASTRAEQKKWKCSLRNKSQTKNMFHNTFAIELWMCVSGNCYGLVVGVRVYTNWFLNKKFASLSMNCGYWDYDASGNAIAVAAAATTAVAIDPKRDFSRTMDT